MQKVTIMLKCGCLPRDVIELPYWLVLALPVNSRIFALLTKKTPASNELLVEHYFEARAGLEIALKHNI